VWLSGGYAAGTVSSDEVHALVDRTPFLREGYALLGRTP